MRYHAQVYNEAKIVVEEMREKVVDIERNRKKANRQTKRVKSLGNIPVSPENMDVLPENIKKLYKKQLKTSNNSDSSSDCLSEVSFVLSEDLNIAHEQLEQDNS